MLMNADLTYDIPPCFICCGECDPLLDNSTTLYEMINDKGFTCEYKVYPGIMHAFLHYSRMLDMAYDAMQDGADFMARARIIKAWQIITVLSDGKQKGECSEMLKNKYDFMKKISPQMRAVAERVRAWNAAHPERVNDYRSDYLEERKFWNEGGPQMVRTEEFNNAIYVCQCPAALSHRQEGSADPRLCPWRRFLSGQQ